MSSQRDKHRLVSQLPADEVKHRNKQIPAEGGMRATRTVPGIYHLPSFTVLQKMFKALQLLASKMTQGKYLKPPPPPLLLVFFLPDMRLNLSPNNNNNNNRRENLDLISSAHKPPSFTSHVADPATAAWPRGPALPGQL